MMIEVAEPRTVGIEEAAALLGIGRTLAYDLARQGRFPVRVLRLGRIYRVPKRELDRLLGNENEGQR